jgi:hypothetical protein
VAIFPICRGYEGHLFAEMGPQGSDEIVGWYEVKFEFPKQMSRRKENAEDYVHGTLWCIVEPLLMNPAQKNGQTYFYTGLGGPLRNRIGGTRITCDLIIEAIFAITLPKIY